MWMMTAKKLSTLLLVLIAVLVNSRWKQGIDVWKEFSTALEPDETIIDGAIDGMKAYTIVSTGQSKDYGNLFVVFHRNESKGWEREYTNDFKALKPWKLELGDVDGDDSTEILIAVRKTTHFDAEEKNRMFIFNYDDGQLIKKWTGSQTAGVWNDFLVGDLLKIKGDELIFVEQAENNEEHLSVYYWFDFGFVQLAESGNFKNILSFSIPVENRIRMTYDKDKVTDLTVQDGKIIEYNNE
jgi:hypothetical protein